MVGRCRKRGKEEVHIVALHIYLGYSTDIAVRSGNTVYYMTQSIYERTHTDKHRIA